MTNSIDVLVIAAHPDDAEVGCGGTLLALRDAGFTTGIVDLTDGEPTPRGNPATRAREAAAAAEVLGVSYRHCLGLPNRFLVDTVEARIAVAEQIRELRPKVVLAHYPDDLHPDHVAAARIAEASRFYAKLSKTEWRGDPHLAPQLYTFVSSHKRINHPISFIVDVSPHFSRKLAAIECYQSQGNVGIEPDGARNFMNVEARAGYYGSLAGAEYGEAFFSAEPIVVGRGIGVLFGGDASNVGGSLGAGSAESTAAGREVDDVD